jgi:hypothetical protein
MAHYGTLKDAPVAEAGEDVRGSHLYGVNDFDRVGRYPSSVLVVGSFQDKPSSAGRHLPELR